MDAKHTPGPWIAEAVMGDYATDICLDYRLPGRESPIVIAAALGDDESNTAEEVAEMEANARLMAAAPDLLAACEALLAEADYMGGIHGVRVMSSDVAKVRAAMAKAKGGGQ